MGALRPRDAVSAAFHPEATWVDPSHPFAQALSHFSGFFLYPFPGSVPTTKIGTNGN